MNLVPERVCVAPVFFTTVKTAKSLLVFSPLMRKERMTALSAILSGPLNEK